MRLECVDDTGTLDALTEGKVYKVGKQLESQYLLSDTVHVYNNQGVLASYFKRRFKVAASNFVRFGDNTVEFTLQNGPIKEAGINGCQIDDVIIYVRDKLQSFQGAVPCRENTHAIDKLDEALMWLEKRKRDRETRGVEGTSGH